MLCVSGLLLSLREFESSGTVVAKQLSGFATAARNRMHSMSSMMVAERGPEPRGPLGAEDLQPTEPGTEQPPGLQEGGGAAGAAWPGAAGSAMPTQPVGAFPGPSPVAEAVFPTTSAWQVPLGIPTVLGSMLFEPPSIPTTPEGTGRFVGMRKQNSIPCDEHRFT